MSKEKITDEKNDPFGDIMEKVGSGGRFQIIYTLFMVSSAIGGSLVYMNIILALNIPDHWCHVPGRNLTNFTESQWKNLTLPESTNNRGEISLSSCKMYNASYEDLLTKADKKADNMSCIYGYEYDKTWYEETIPMKENWVCEKDLYVTNVFIISRMVKIVGSVFIGYLGDALGRQLVYAICVVIVVFGRILTILTTDSFDYFLPATGIALLAITGFFQMPYIIGIEISNEKVRANMTVCTMMGWSIATCLLAISYWWLRHWMPFLWVTTLPTILVFAFGKYMIESPRWLIGRKKFKLALKQFNKIAKINGKEFNMSEKELDAIFKKVKKEKIYGIPSLFSNWRLAKNTIIIELVWCVVGVAYFTLTLFSASMGGNPFLNFFLQSVVEVPALFIGKYLSNTYGRRVTNFAFLWLSGLACIPVIFLTHDLRYEYLVIALTIFIKFINGITNLAASLQEVEMYPTCLRSSGMSLGGILTNLLSCVSPYIVYLGTNVDMRAPYFILAAFFILGGCAAMFLPETLHQKLPDTIEEAKIFGRDQKFWSIPKTKKDTNIEDDIESEKLNQKKYAL